MLNKLNVGVHSWEYLHTKFGWILFNGLVGDGITDRRTDGGDNNIPFAVLKKHGDIYH